MINIKHGKISAVRQTSDGQVFIKISDQHGLVGGKIRDVTADLVEIPKTETNFRAIKHSPQSISGVRVKEEEITIAGGPSHRIISSNRFGNIIHGHTTFTAHPESIRMGGFFRLNGLHTSTMPSTIITPIPLFILDVPGKQMLSLFKGLLNDAKKLTSLII